MISKENIEKWIDRNRRKADKAFQTYQETGISRYLNEYNNAEELADALALSLDAADEHLALVNLRGELCNLADRAEQILQMPINDNEKIKLCKSVISLAVTCARYKRRLDHAAD